MMKKALIFILMLLIYLPTKSFSQPIISAITPNESTVGHGNSDQTSPFIFEIIGQGFTTAYSIRLEGDRFSFDLPPQSFEVISNNLIKVTLNPEITSGMEQTFAVTVFTDDGSSLPGAQTHLTLVQKAPLLESINPNPALSGTEIILTGKYFPEYPYIIVLFGDEQIFPTQIGSPAPDTNLQTIKIIVPPKIGSSNVPVTVAAGEWLSNTLNFTYGDTPLQINSAKVRLQNKGVKLVIRGTNLSKAKRINFNFNSYLAKKDFSVTTTCNGKEQIIIKVPCLIRAEPFN